MKRIFIISILLIALFNSCKKETDLAHLKDFFYMRYKGADMPVYVEGNAASGVFVIVLHGGPGGDAQIYNNYNKGFSNTLEKKYAMVYYDQRGSGNCSGKFNPSLLDVNQHVEDLEKLIELLKKKYGDTIKLFLMGHSWGGTLGTAFLVKEGNQEKITAWIEVDGAHDFSCNLEVYYALRQISQDQINAGNHKVEWQQIYDYTEDIDTTDFTDENIAMLNQFGYKAEEYLIADGLITTDSFDIAGAFDYLWFSGHDPMVAKFNLRVVSVTMFDQVKNLDYTPQMYKINIPCLFMWGKLDFVIPYELAYQAYDAVSSTDKKVVLFEHSGHSVMYYEMYSFLDELTEFIDAHK